MIWQLPIILSVFVIGTIECMLEEWKKHDSRKILDAYFAPNVTNGDKVKNLSKAFSDSGINVDNNVFWRVKTTGAVTHGKIC